jgi:predicted secreted protein
MSSQDFPTYGRGEEPEQPGEEHHYAQPAPYSGSTYTSGRHADPHAGPYAQPQPGAYGPPPGQYGVPPQGPDAYTQPPNYRPGNPYGTPAHPQQHELPTYGREQPAAPRDPRAARVVLLATIIAAVYGLLVLTVQRVALREISQAPGSPLNHPLRTDVIDTIGQLLLLLVGAAAIALWARDVLARRKVGRQLDPIELGGLLLVGVSMVPILIWLLMVLSTGMGAVDDSLDRLPTAYGWGGTGLLILAVGFALGYRELKADVSNPVVKAPPARPPWE